MNNVQTIIGKLCDYVVGEDESLKFFAIDQLIDFGKLGYFVIHQEQVDEVGK